MGAWTLTLRGGRARTWPPRDRCCAMSPCAAWRQPCQRASVPWLSSVVMTELCGQRWDLKGLPDTPLTLLTSTPILSSALTIWLPWP